MNDHSEAWVIELQTRLYAANARAESAEAQVEVSNLMALDYRREREAAEKERDSVILAQSAINAQAERAEAEVARLREALREQGECWLEDERGWRLVLSYFQAQSDADRHDAKELIAAIEQRASTVAANARALAAEETS